jgi:hypothetical protein
MKINFGADDATSQIRRVVIAASGADLARLLGPRAIHLEDLRADYGQQILIERGLRHDEGLRCWPARFGHADLRSEG